MIEKIVFLMSRITFLNYLIAVFAFVGAFFLPLSFFTEGGLIETIEALTLLLSSVFCFVESKKSRNFSSFFITCGLIFLILVGRELSWGRIFFTNELGEVIKRRDWFLGSYIYYILSPLFLFLLVYAIKTKFVRTAFVVLKKIVNKNSTLLFIYADCTLVVAMIIGSIVFESHYTYLLPESLHYMHIALEETAEVVMYFVVALLIKKYSRFL